jgi:hypothetical protein
VSYLFASLLSFFSLWIAIVAAVKVTNIIIISYLQAMDVCVSLSNVGGKREHV